MSPSEQTAPPPASSAAPVDVLAFAPHPDDIEIGCGGTLLLCADAGLSVGLVDLTRGEMGTRGSAELRAEEAELGRQRLMARFRENLGLPDGGVDSRSREQLLAVVSALRRHRPRLVFICSEHDRHPDHVEAAHLVERACFFAGLAEYPAAGQPHRPARLAFYMGRLTFEPRFIVDVTPVFERKMQAVLAFQSQFFRTADDPRVTPISEPGFLERLAGRFRHYGGRIGTEFGEPFDMREPFGLSGVAGLFGPASPTFARVGPPPEGAVGPGGGGAA